MSLDIIEDRLQEYQSKTKQEELCALKEIYQEIALSGLARSEFFKIGAFQGGTCLRILYGLRRFSEDLDFVLLLPDKPFRWEQYLKPIEIEFQSFGVNIEILDRSQADSTIKKAFLKQNSLGKILRLQHDFLPSDKQSIRIKLEVDVNPPAGSSYETQYLNYPYPFSILCQDLPSLFATKCHALLCRKYDKGRDWFDFLWYSSKRVPINFKLFANALFQAGPFKGMRLEVDLDWLIKSLRSKIDRLDWKEIRFDVENLLKGEDKKYVQTWSKDLFFAALKDLH